MTPKRSIFVLLALLVLFALVACGRGGPDADCMAAWAAYDKQVETSAHPPPEPTCDPYPSPWYGNDAIDAPDADAGAEAGDGST